MKLTLLSGFEFDTSNVFRIYFNGDLQTADVLDLNGEPLCTIRGSHEYENLRSLCEGDFDDLRRKAWEIDGRVPPRRMFPDKTAPQMNVKGVAEAIAAVAGSRLHPTHIHSAVPVTAAASASPAPAPERVNLWTAVQAGHYDSPKEEGVRIADRVVGALERDKPVVICVGNVLYYREDKAIADAKELRERAATLISSLRTVVDEAIGNLRNKPTFHHGCGGLVVGDSDLWQSITHVSEDEIYWNFRCSKCQETFIDIKEATGESLAKRPRKVTVSGERFGKPEIKVTVVDDAKYRSSAEFGRGNSPSRPSVKPKKKPAKKGAKRRR